MIFFAVAQGHKGTLSWIRPDARRFEVELADHAFSVLKARISYSLILIMSQIEIHAIFRVCGRVSSACGRNAQHQPTLRCAWVKKGPSGVRTFRPTTRAQIIPLFFKSVFVIE